MGDFSAVERRRFGCVLFMARAVSHRLSLTLTSCATVKGGWRYGLSVFFLFLSMHDENDATEEETTGGRTTRVGRPRGGMKVACSENRRWTAKGDRQGQKTKG